MEELIKFLKKTKPTYSGSNIGNIPYDEGYECCIEKIKNYINNSNQ